jgi:hypothetical protein
MIRELQMKVCGVRYGTSKRCSMLDLEQDETVSDGPAVTIYGVDNEILASYGTGNTVKITVDTVRE